MGIFGKKPSADTQQNSPKTPANNRKHLSKGPNINSAVKVEKPPKQTKADKARAFGMMGHFIQQLQADLIFPGN